MKTTADEIITAIRKHFKGNIVAASYSLFIEPLKFVGFEDDILILEIYSEWSKSIIDKRFIEGIQFAVKNLFNQEVKVNIITT